MLPSSAKQYHLPSICFHPVAADYAPIGGLCPVDYLLEQLPEMSKEELVELSEKVHKLRHQRRSDEKG